MQRLPEMNHQKAFSDRVQLMSKTTGTHFTMPQNVQLDGDPLAQLRKPSSNPKKPIFLDLVAAASASRCRSTRSDRDAELLSEHGNISRSV